MSRLPVCSHCGMAIGDHLFVRQGKACCCENCFLDKRLSPRRMRANDIYTGFVEALTETLDFREHETGLHSKRVACHTQVLARRFIHDPQQLRQITWGALLHDIGKIGIPDHILLKQEALTGDEWQIMRTHPDMGYRIVGKLPEMAEAADLVRCHEERFDGTGYPRGLRGTLIPLSARLFAVIDTLDAMTSDRPYRQGVSFDVAKQEIVRLENVQFDPLAVEAFLAEETILREMVALKCGPQGTVLEGALEGIHNEEP